MAAPSVLVVEDDSSVREMLRFVLQQYDFEILEAADAEDAKNSIDVRQPSVILLDWMLPGMSGIEFSRLLKNCLLYTSDAADE